MRLTRDVAAITMDIDGIETLAFRALGGADTVTVGDLAGTEVEERRRRPDAIGGGGDGAADTVVVHGTAGADEIRLGNATASSSSVGCPRRRA